MQDFRNLTVWKRGHQLTLAVYRVTASFPADETYGLRSQIRRCAYSIPANIAEGSGRGSDAEFSRFLLIAMGSAAELEYFLILGRDLGFVPADVCTPLHEEVIEVRRMLNAFIQTLKKGHRDQNKAGNQN